MNTKNFQNRLAEVVNAARLEKGMTQKELGIKMGYSENSAGQVVHKIEEGKIGIPKKKIQTLLEVLDITHEKLGLDKSISLPIWIASGAKKGSRMSFKDFLSTAETVVAGIAELSETVVTGVTEISGTVAQGVVEMSETMLTGGTSSKRGGDAKTEKDLNSLKTSGSYEQQGWSFMKELTSKNAKPRKMTKAEQIRLVTILCRGDQKKIEKIKEILKG